MILFKKLGIRTFSFIFILLLLIITLYSFWKLEIVSLHLFIISSIMSIAFIFINIVDRFRQMESEGAKLSKQGDELFKKGEINGAAARYKEAIIYCKNCYKAHLGLGHCYRIQENWDLAVENFKQAYNIEPGSAISHYYAGVAHQKAGRIKDAVFEVQQAIQLNSDLLEAYLTAGDIYKSIGDDDDAISMYNKFIENNLDEESNTVVQEKLDLLKKIKTSKLDNSD